MNKVTEENITSETYLCLHCGNETLMKKVGAFEWGSNDEKDYNFCYSFKYQLLFCPVCHKITLLETYGDESMEELSCDGIMEYYYKNSVLYPINTIDSSAMPEKIKDAFESVLKVKNIDLNACSLLLRRILEMILKDQGATKWGLEKMVEEMASKGILPKSLQEASFFTKQYGDSAAHNKGLIADKCDIENLVEFVKYIIEYLYILPVKIDQFKKKIDEHEKHSV